MPETRCGRDVGETEPVRLDRFIANNSHLSRKQVRRLLRDGSVVVDGHCALDPALQIDDDSEVLIDGEPLQAAGEIYLMLNKPAGYVCANRDDRYPVVMDLLDEAPVRELHVAGRLDVDTTGLVLLTSDGQWSHRLTTPRSDCRKIYRVELERPLTERMIERLELGIYLPGEGRRTRPATVERIDASVCRLGISEGRYHQVKRMFGALENPVLALHRERIGAIELDPALAPGESRALTAAEVASANN